MSSRLPLDARRAQLLELGLALFGARSYEDVSIDDIAREAGISRGLLYHYFGGKREFYVATVELAASRMLEASEPPLDLPPEARALYAIDAYFRFVEDRAAAFLALMHGGLGVDARVQGIVEATRQAFVDRILEGLGLDGPQPILRLALRGWIGAVEASSLAWLPHKPLPREALAGLLLSGLEATLRAVMALDPAAGAVIAQRLGA